MRPVQAATATPLLMKCDAIYAMCFEGVTISSSRLNLPSCNRCYFNDLFISVLFKTAHEFTKLYMYSEMILDFQHEGRPIAIFVRRVPLLKTVQSHCI